MGRDKKNKKNKPEDTIDIRKMNSKTGLIDASSIKEYKAIYDQNKDRYGQEANPKMEEYVETRLHKTVDEQKKKRKRDITSVAASTATGTIVPFSGIPIMVATTMVQCVGFSASLGLIPIANALSFQDVNTLATQMTATLQKASSSGLKAAIEAFVLDVLKNGGIGKWLWEEILKDTVIEMTGGAVMDSAWVLSALFLPPKYYLHRKLIKKMYVTVGEKAIVVHKAWVNEHLFFGKPETVKIYADQRVAAAVGATAFTESHPGFPSAYPTTVQPYYESNADEGVPDPVNSQPAFASSEHRAETHPQDAPIPHANEFPQHHPQSQYAYHPSSYPMQQAPGLTNSSSGSQHQQYPQQYPPQQYGLSTNASSNSNPGQNNSQAPPVGYPRNQQGQNGDSGYMYSQSAPQQVGYARPSSSTAAPTYSQGPTIGYPSESFHGAYNNLSSYPSAPPFQQAPATRSSHHSHSQSAPPSGASYSYSVQQSHFPSSYPAAEQKPEDGKVPYGSPAVQQHEQYYPAPS